MSVNDGEHHEGDDSVSSSDGSFMPPVLSDYANQLLFEDKERQSRLQYLQQQESYQDSRGANVGYQQSHHYNQGSVGLPNGDYSPVDKMVISPQVPKTSRRELSGSPHMNSSGGISSSSLGTSPLESSDKISNASTTPGIRPAATLFTRAPAADMTSLRTTTMRSKRFGSNAFNKRLGKPLNFKGLPSANPNTTSNSTSTAISSMAQLSVSSSTATSSNPASNTASMHQPLPATTTSFSAGTSSMSIPATSLATTTATRPANIYSSLSGVDEDRNPNLSPSTKRSTTRIRFAEEHQEIAHDSPRRSYLLRHSKSSDNNSQYHDSDIGEANSSVSSNSSKRDRRDWSSRATTPVGDTSRHSSSSKSDHSQYDANPQQGSLSQFRAQDERPVLQSISPNIPVNPGNRFGSKVPPPKLENWANVKTSSLFSSNELHEYHNNHHNHHEVQEPERPAPPVPTDRADRAARIERFEKAAEQQSVAQLHAAHNLGTDRPRQSSDRSKTKKNMMAINNRLYQRLELLGRGGSSKVYKVQSNEGKVFAVKKVTFEDVDESVISGFKGEIDLLQRLRNEDRVVKLVDYEMHDTSVYLVMECGEIDLAHVLSARLNSQLDISFVRFYATEMLRCVAAVHNQGIVHSDLKPANFLLVKGMLKIIDFGIANVVPDYTANIHRDTQIGTPNYMAPEALLDANQFGPGSGTETAAKFKVGKPSDVWSCGCIIYQMVYGKPPYAAYSGAQRMLAIMNPKVQIQYPKHGLGGVRVSRDAIETIRGCLHRDPAARMTVEEVLEGSFLNPQAVDRSFIRTLLEHAVQYGATRKEPILPREVDMLTDDIWKKIQLSNR
ncbi:serine/threonine/tyrosine protein kinase MPS1 [Sugiyamaella lignohabitans]|uniref:Serine/threonine/tyrosine protein kinase MPS1 n=1 Tax=Sugiyamaella lignohabitans TaxID=796027 RepID=A0A167BZ37_9ASCO|nr:serine/threonine/tyrosine protein kinase MPS1 [Sugiyamaella lignohabitans]ANB11003.1 serine/threonine/tyrosine protein kinase MPS1 [Sugiyamaella lignohabitans]